MKKIIIMSKYVVCCQMVMVSMWPPHQTCFFHSNNKIICLFVFCCFLLFFVFCFLFFFVFCLLFVVKWPTVIDHGHNVTVTSSLFFPHSNNENSGKLGFFPRPNANKTLRWICMKTNEKKIKWEHCAIFHPAQECFCRVRIALEIALLIFVCFLQSIKSATAFN